MSFSEAAQAQLKVMESREKRTYMHSRGWLETRVPIRLLEELGIEHEPVEEGSMYLPGVWVYAPVWVHGVWLRAWDGGVKAVTSWGIVKRLLVTSRDNLGEREALSAELALDMGLPRPVREAARHYLDALRERSHNLKST